MNHKIRKLSKLLTFSIVLSLLVFSTSPLRRNTIQAINSEVAGESATEIIDFENNDSDSFTEEDEDLEDIEIDENDEDFISGEDNNEEDLGEEGLTEELPEDETEDVIFEEDADEGILEDEKTDDISDVEEATNDSKQELLNPKETEDNLTFCENNSQNNEHKNLGNGEALICSYQKLRQLIEGSGTEEGFHTYYLGQDITGDDGKFTVPNGYEFTIDGTTPNTNIRHKLTQPKNGSSGDAIRYEGSITGITLSIQNINLVGGNYFGILSTNKNITLEYKNVEYIGRQIGYATGGTIILDNVDVTQDNRYGTTHEVVQANHIIFKGNNNLNYKGDKVLFNVGDSILFEENSSTNIVTNSYLTLTGLDSIKLGLKSSLTVEDHADFATEISTVLSSEELINNGSININNKTIKGNAINVSGSHSSKKGYILNNGTINTNNESISGNAIDASSYIINNGLMNINSNSVNNAIVTTENIVNDGSILIESNKIAGNAILATHDIVNTGAIELNVLELGGEAIKNSNTYSVIRNEEGKMVFKGRDYKSYLIYAYDFQNNGNSSLIVEVDSHHEDAMIWSRAITFDNSEAVITLGNEVSKKKSIFKSSTGSPRVKINDSRIKIDTGAVQYTNIFENAGAWEFTSSGNVPSYLVVVNNSAGNKSLLSKSGNVKTQQINLWNELPKFSDRNLNPDERPGMTKCGVYTQKKDVNACISKPLNSSNTPITINGFNSTNKTVVAMGNMVLDIPSDVSTSRSIKTNPNARVEFDLKENGIPVDYVANADDNGNVTWAVDDLHGEYKVLSSGDYLFKESDMLIEGKLRISKFPENLDFGKVELGIKKNFNLPEDIIIEIEDGRIKEKGWTLTLQMTVEGLHVPNEDSKLDDVLKFKDKTLSTEEITIMSYDDPNYLRTKEINISANDGFNLLVKDYRKILLDEQYKAQLVWKLYPKEN